MFIFSISLAYEEAAHSGIFIIQGRKDEVVSLCFNMVVIKNIKIIGIGVTVYFKGKITDNDILHTSLAGPISSLLMGIISSFVICISSMILKTIGYTCLLENISLVIIGFLCLPLSSLVPIKIGFIETDGYKIVKLKGKYKLSNKVLAKAAYDLIRYLTAYIKLSV